MKRAALIITDRERITHDAEGPEDGVRPLRAVAASEQLLADLRDAIECVDAEVSWARSLDDRDPEAARLKQVAARLREWVPEGGTP